MTASAEERASALAPHLDNARQQVASLHAAVKDAEQQAHDSYVRGDIATADGAHAKAARLRQEHATAAAKLETFEAAALAVHQERQRERLEAHLAELNERYAKR